MPIESRHLTVWIKRRASDVYEYASDPVHIPTWAPGLGTSIELVDGTWFIGSGEGRVALQFAEQNPFGVLDHRVTLPSGEVIYVPLRVIADGDESEVVVTLRRQPGVRDDEFARDARTVQADLDRLKRILEAAD